MILPKQVAAEKNEEKNTAKIFVWIFGNGAPFPVRVDG